MALVGVFALLGACEKMPDQGPSTAEIFAANEAGTEDFVVVNVDARLAEALSRPDGGTIGARFGSQAVSLPTDKVSIGDTLSIRIIEAGRDELFSATGGGTFPDVTVGPQGSISLPFIGTLAVAGKTPAEIEAEIVAGLAGRAIEPQAVVTQQTSASNTVTVNGAVAKSGIYPLTLRQVRLSDVIAAAGGPTHADYETRVTLLRGGKTAASRLDAVFLQPSQNVVLQRGDQVVLSHEPPRYTITGAVSVSQAGTFDAPELSLLEAVSRARGLTDESADAEGVFVFRQESTRLLKGAGVAGLERFGTAARIPTIYRINMQDVSARFYAQNFLLRDGDAIYVANSDVTQLNKVVTLLSAGLYGARQGQLVVTN